jgi:cytochrome b
MQKVYVWDPLVRVFHWSLAISFTANAFVIDKDSNLHEYVGYTVMSLVLIRILWGFVGGQYARFKSFPPSINNSVEQLTDLALRRKRVHLGHTPLGALMIYNLLASLLLLTLSGFLMTTDLFWGTEWTEELHEACFNWVEFSALLHIAAVLYESHRTKINLIYAMVTGSKTIPTNGE